MPSKNAGAGTVTVSIWQARLAAYLELEALLNRLFNAMDYCYRHCIAPAREKGEAGVGCCKDRYYRTYDLDHPAYELLRRERQKRYGPPVASAAAASPCEYHTLRGCRLLTHKSPICLSFFCREGLDHLRSRYHLVQYDYLGVYYALEWTLTGDLAGQALSDFRRSLHRMIDTVESHRPSPLSARPGEPPLPGRQRT